MVEHVVQLRYAGEIDRHCPIASDDGAHFFARL